MPSVKLPRDFYDRPTLDVARDLIGRVLVRRGPRGRRLAGRIVETEAYLGADGDRAAHSWRGPTPRTRSMFGPPGRAYVYFVYGMHHCVNVVTEAEGRACAVLLRALEPLEGLSARTSGPALLCRALGIDRRLDGADLRGRDLWIEDGDPPPRIATARRIGVDYAGSWARKPWRFLDPASPFVSRPTSA